MVVKILELGNMFIKTRLKSSCSVQLCAVTPFFATKQCAMLVDSSDNITGVKVKEKEREVRQEEETYDTVVGLMLLFESQEVLERRSRKRKRKAGVAVEDGVPKTCLKMEPNSPPSSSFIHTSNTVP